MHEISHFRDGAYTQDLGVFPYASANQQALAKTNPVDASRSAYNYAYFSEDAAGCGCTVGKRNQLTPALLVVAALAAFLVRRRNTMTRSAFRVAAVSLALLATSTLAACAIQVARAQAPVAPRALPPVEHSFTCQNCPREDRLQCNFTAPPTVRTGEAAPLTFRLRNQGTEALRILKERSPFMPFANDDFRITCNGRDIERRVDIVAHRFGAPSPSSYLTIASGEEQQTTIDLTHDYTLPPGTCRIEWRGVLNDVQSDPTLQPRTPTAQRPATLHCNAVEIQIAP